MTGFNDGAGTFKLAATGVGINLQNYGAQSAPVATTTQSFVTSISVNSYLVNAISGQVFTSGNMTFRPGVDPPLVTVASSHPDVGQIQRSPLRLSTGYNTQTVDFIPTAPGDTDVSVIQPPGYVAPTDQSKISFHVTLPSFGAGTYLLAKDTMMSWLPLFHDMGMVGFLTVPMTIGVELVKVTPADFLAGPLLWPALLSKYRANVTAAPNFAYAMVGRRMAKTDEVYDLSHLRLALNGAEPIDEAAVANFVSAGARFGMRPECVLPAYGMAEATLAVSFAPLFTGLTLDVIDADELEANNRAVPASSGNTRAFSLLGPPLPGLEVTAVDDTGKVLGDREVGELRVRGAAVTPGYLTMQGPMPTQDADGWLATGDLGYLVDGQVVVCGRRKDVIIMGGRNIYPTDIERAALSVDGVRAGNAVAVRLDAGTRRERFAVAVESTLAGNEEAERTLTKEITSKVVDAVGMRPVGVFVLRAGSLPKTPSGKLRRSAAAAWVSEKLLG